MENASEALKMVFGIIMFVLALALSISCLSQAIRAVDTITVMRDRETEYTYVSPASNSNKIVGAETVIPTMYKAYKENFKIVFYQIKNGKQEPLYLYNYYDPNGNMTQVNYVDLENEILPNATEAINHLNVILGPMANAGNYARQFIRTEGLYQYFKEKKFEEILGEYYQEDALAGEETDAIEINKTKKRIITYIMQ